MTAPAHGTGSVERARTPVAVLGATGLVGQRIIERLESHPTLEVTEVVASGRRDGVRYEDAVQWSLPGDIPAAVARTTLKSLGAPLSAPVVLSALPAEVARRVETRLAREGKIVCSNAATHRMRRDVPLIVPEVNGGTISLAQTQPWAGGGGAVITNPNCVVAGLALALAPIHREWGIRGGVIVTLQALSGAGLAGPSAMSMTGNVVPHIPNEAPKIPEELNKVLGLSGDWAVAVNRVPVVDGHTAHVFLDLDRPADPGEVQMALGAFRASGSGGRLDSLPVRPLEVRTEPDRPQPRLDVDRGRGMTVTVGQLREAPPHDLALCVLSHNTVRGAAGGCIANAELALAAGLLAHAVAV